MLPLAYLGAAPPKSFIFLTILLIDLWVNIIINQYVGLQHFQKLV